MHRRNSEQQEFAMNRSIQLTIGLALSLVAGSCLAETVYVQAKQAKLMSEPNLKSEVVTAVEQGTALEQLAEQGRWLKVEHAGKQAWIYRLLISKQPPMKKVTVLGGHDENLTENARKRASSNAAVAAARGLRNDERSRESDQQMSDFHALEKVEAQSVNEQELQDFMEQSEQ